MFGMERKRTYPVRPLDYLLFVVPPSIFFWWALLILILFEETGLARIPEEEDSAWVQLKRDIRTGIHWLWIQLGVRYPMKRNLVGADGSPVLTLKQWKELDRVLQQAAKVQLQSWNDLFAKHPSLQNDLIESLEEPTCR